MKIHGQCRFCEHTLGHAWHDNGEFNDAKVGPPPTQVDSKAVRVREGDPRFLKLLDDIEQLHAMKQRDYGKDIDPFANVRAAEEWGISPWLGAMIRLTDKVRRLQSYATNGSLANEGVEDSLKDMAVYALIALILWREERKPSKTQTN